MKNFLCWVLVFVVASECLAMRGALYRTGRSVPLIPGMQNGRHFIIQDFLRFGRSAGFEPRGEDENLLLERFPRSQLARLPWDYGFIV